MRMNRGDHGALRLLFAVSLLPVTLSASRAEDTKAEEVVKAIRSYFESVTPELSRYSRVTVYGETLSSSAFSKESHAREAALFMEAAAAGLLKSPPLEVLSLGHNLIVHEPIAGEAYLKALHESADLGNQEVAQAIVASTCAAGEAGEKIAVAELTSKIKDRRLFWAHYLEQNAIYLSSVEAIQKAVVEESESSSKVSLMRALANIGSPKSLALIKDVLERATDDNVQAAAIFTYVELAGFDGIAYVDKIKTIGPKSSAERQESLEWLKKETRSDSKHGREVSNDSEFVNRFGDLGSSPVIRWLNKEELLEESILGNPPRLSPDKKKDLLGMIIDSKGFGLEAAKGTLFRSLSKEDEPLLLKIRAVSFYSPNDLSGKRRNTIGIMIRHLRQDL